MDYAAGSGRPPHKSPCRAASDPHGVELKSHPPIKPYPPCAEKVTTASDNGGGLHLITSLLVI